MTVETKLYIKPMGQYGSAIGAVGNQVVVAVRRGFYGVGQRTAVTTISEESFAELARAMLDANSETAKRAFADAIAAKT